MTSVCRASIGAKRKENRRLEFGRSATRVVAKRNAALREGRLDLATVRTKQNPVGKRVHMQKRKPQAPGENPLIRPQHSSLPHCERSIEQQQGNTAIARVGWLVGDQRLGIGDPFDPSKAGLGKAASDQLLAGRLGAAR